MGDLEQAAAFLFQEARHLDRHEWDAWVAMYREDAVYWLPAWRDEYETTADPQTEVSLIFHSTRLGLEERIARIESRKSITALPLPPDRTHRFPLSSLSGARLDVWAGFRIRCCRNRGRPEPCHSRE